MQSVLPWHVPVVPHESHRVGLPRLSKVLIEASTQLAGEVSIQEVLDDPQVLGRSLGLDGWPLARAWLGGWDCWGHERGGGVVAEG